MYLTLNKILKLSQGRLLNKGAVTEVNGVYCDSRQVTKDSLFIAIKGESSDGHLFIKEAIKKGAKIVVVEDIWFKSLKSYDRSKLLNEGISIVLARDNRYSLSKAADYIYGQPSKKMDVIAVTGTNGKTTITYLIEKILNKANFKTGVVGTINYRFDNKVFASKNTTPGPLEIQRLLKSMVDTRTDYCVIEVSSHALSQARVSSVYFKSAIFTNLTQDHLDYHKDMKSYFLAKSKLFSGLSSLSRAIINVDDKYARRLALMTKAKVTTYAIKSNADFRAEDIKLNVSGSEFSIVKKGLCYRVKTSLIGLHNVYNILAAFSFGFLEGISPGLITDAISEFSSVPGRLQLVKTKTPFKVFVDYAHTDDALKNVLVSLSKVKKKDIILVFGCGGDRDKTKRPKMGAVASRFASHTIITSDNPRSEDPGQIVKQIIKGFKTKNYDIVIDREKAIHKALAEAKKGDIVLIAGKGHESYQIFKNKKIPFDDVKIVKGFFKDFICSR